VRFLVPDELQAERQWYELPAPVSGAVRGSSQWLGWVAGTCAPGRSVPVYSPHDGETLPEVFSPAGWAAVLEQITSPARPPVRLVWQHGGPAIASTDAGTLRFRIHRTCGLMFEARLAREQLDEIVLEQLTPAGLPTSVCYHDPEQRIVVDQTVGRVRIIDACRISHVALLPVRSGAKPAYPAARAYGLKSTGESCPFTPRANATRYACVVLSTRQETRVPISAK
jgi:hypothetical protein